MSNHTPGPWVFYDDSNDGKTNRIEIVATGKTVARIYNSVQAEDLPNARLIAAAPELLEALVAVMKLHCPYTGNPTAEQIVAHWEYEREQGNGSAQTMLDALAAIAKATGQP